MPTIRISEQSKEELNAIAVKLTIEKNEPVSAAQALAEIISQTLENDKKKGRKK